MCPSGDITTADDFTAEMITPYEGLSEELNSLAELR